MMLKPKEIKHHFNIKDFLFMFTTICSIRNINASEFALKSLEKAKPVGPHLIQVRASLAFVMEEADPPP